MYRRWPDTLDRTPTPSSPHGRVAGSKPPTPAGRGSAPQDWSELGRRVLAEAWRRTTDELAARAMPAQEPVVPAPGREGTA